jgi:hypothetical protein
MKNSANKIFNAALVISGMKLLYDFSKLNLYTLEAMLANMQFCIAKQIPDSAIFLYTSLLHRGDVSTVVFINRDHGIKNVRYLNLNMEHLFL